ncbi:MAG: tol-pal system protein YbgF [Rhodocyclaceae bacterium]|nr:tol-pal system protein YbgF [Rhodocyclaceae bacterium]MBX3669050.1 tol-pal system protein YbgF [Rhodocyclaceae bacterium]
MKKFCSLLLLVAATGAHAGMFDDDEARNRVTQLRTEVTARLERLEAASRAQIETANQIEELRSDVAKLRGQIEELTYELEQINKRQKDFYVDLDNRLRKLEAPAQATGDAAAGTAAAKPVDPAQETRDYEAALNLLKSGKFKDAANAFAAFAKNYPGGNYLPAATFWQASSLFQARDWRGAAELYRDVSTRWPTDTRAPDALLGLANCQTELGDTRSARKTLESLTAKYPGTPPAEVARQRLAKK